MSEEPKPDFSLAFSAFVTALVRALEVDTGQAVQSRLETELDYMLLPEAPISKTDKENLEKLRAAFRQAIHRRDHPLGPLQ